MESALLTVRGVGGGGGVGREGIEERGKWVLIELTDDVLQNFI